MTAGTAIVSAQDPVDPPAPPASWQVVYQGKYTPNGADYTILDLFEFNRADVAKAKYPIAYFSAHYENWRPDKKRFGKLLRPISGWAGERYINWRDKKNRRVMIGRLKLAKSKGFKGVDIDNIDGPNTKAYFRWLVSQAHRRGLTVTMKNAVEHLNYFGPRVDFFVSEATKLNEMTVYKRFDKPTVRMYYRKGAKTPDFIYQVINRQNGNRF